MRETRLESAKLWVGGSFCMVERPVSASHLSSVGGGRSRFQLPLSAAKAARDHVYERTKPGLLEAERTIERQFQMRMFR
jgi:hypothetical protein